MLVDFLVFLSVLESSVSLNFNLISTLVSPSRSRSFQMLAKAEDTLTYTCGCNIYLLTLIILSLQENGQLPQIRDCFTLTFHMFYKGVSLVVQKVKTLPAMQEIQIRSLCQEDPLEKGMATYSCILAWKIPQTEGSGGLQSMGWQN